MTKMIHILVVDDEDDVQPLFEQTFRKEIKAKTIDFHFSFSADEALAYLEDPSTRAEMTLILSDINMPGMNGLELLRVIKELYPKLPVLMVSAYGDEKNQLTATNYGADGFITKPIDFSQLKQDILHFAQDMN